MADGNNCFVGCFGDLFGDELGDFGSVQGSTRRPIGTLQTRVGYGALLVKRKRCRFAERGSAGDGSEGFNCGLAPITDGTRHALEGAEAFAFAAGTSRARALSHFDGLGFWSASTGGSVPPLRSKFLRCVLGMYCGCICVLELDGVGLAAFWVALRVAGVQALDVTGPAACVNARTSTWKASVPGACPWVTANIGTAAGACVAGALALAEAA